MRNELKSIAPRILSIAVGALTQANQHAVYADPGMDHWGPMSVLNAAQAGELFLKAIIAAEHPLLLFRDLFQLEEPTSAALSLKDIVQRGRTYAFEHLPRLLWVATGERLPDPHSYERIKKARNSIQHFLTLEDDATLRRISLEFLYRNVDPLIRKHFGLFAIEYHEDHVGYDYVVQCLIEHELPFSVPPNFSVQEINFDTVLGQASPAYRKACKNRIAASKQRRK